QPGVPELTTVGLDQIKMQFGTKIAVTGRSRGQKQHGIANVNGVSVENFFEEIAAIRELRVEFDSQFPYSGDLFEEVFDADAIHVRYPMLFLTARAPGHSDLGPELHLDLVEANRRQLGDAGLRAEHISIVDGCTACDTARFFSHRAE